MSICCYIKILNAQYIVVKISKNEYFHSLVRDAYPTEFMITLAPCLLVNGLFTRYHAPQTVKVFRISLFNVYMLLYVNIKSTIYCDKNFKKRILSQSLLRGNAYRGYKNFPV
jgi:hypothetical protein